MNERNLENQPLVSAIIPTYNRPDYLRQAIASAVNQTYSNLEIIVSDNCSPENPQAIVESFNDPRIRFYRRDRNIGLVANIISAFQLAQGKYVASLHDDDLWEPDFLAKLVPPLEANQDLVLSFCDHYVIDAQGNINPQATARYSQHYKRRDLKSGTYQPFYQLALVDQAVSSATAAVMRRDAADWNNIPLEVGTFIDLYINYLYCRDGKGAYYVPEKLTRYREHSQTDTILSRKQDPSKKIAQAQSAIFYFGSLIADKNLQTFTPYFQQQYWQALVSLGIGLLRQQKLAAARPYLLDAWQQQKFNCRALAALALSFLPEKLARISIDIYYQTSVKIV